MSAVSVWISAVPYAALDVAALLGAGCINDARCMKYMLTTKLGFKEEQVLMLTGAPPRLAGTPPVLLAGVIPAGVALSWLPLAGLFFGFGWRCSCASRLPLL